jgi:hypothetical protein
MERPYANPDTKHLRWTTTPSEEHLLGSPLLATSSLPAVSFEPPPPQEWAVADEVGAPHEPSAATPRWRPQARDLIALAAVAVAVWFAVRGASGVPFRSVEAATPTTANAAGTQVLADRRELSSLPRESAAKTSANGLAGGHGGGKKDSGTRGGGRNDQPPATGGGKNDPLVQATVPGVGSVTVEKPTVPDTGVPLQDLPSLPETEIAVPGTVTVALP